MSHIVTITTQIPDPVALEAACQRLGLAAPAQGTARLYEGEVTGHIVQLPGWTYPVVIDTESCQIRYDNFGGSWGKPQELGKLLQAYAVEKARIEARKAGHSVSEQRLEDGSIKLTVQVGGHL